MTFAILLKLDVPQMQDTGNHSKEVLWVKREDKSVKGEFPAAEEHALQSHSVMPTMPSPSPIHPRWYLNVSLSEINDTKGFLDCSPVTPVVDGGHFGTAALLGENCDKWC